MPNFMLIGFGEKTEHDLFRAIRLNMLLHGFKHNDVVATFEQRDNNESEKENICAFGFLPAEAEKVNKIIGCFPKGIDVTFIDSKVINLWGRRAPYVEVNAETPERLDVIVKHMKQMGLGCDVEMRLIDERGKERRKARMEYGYPYVKVVTTELTHLGIIEKSVIPELNKIGAKLVYVELIDGSVDAKDMKMK